MPQERVDVQSLISASRNEDEKDLLRVFPDIVQELKDTLLFDADLGDANEHYEQVMDVPLLCGKRGRALMLLKACRELITNPTAHEWRLVRLLAWCYQISFSSSTLIDEIIFDQETAEDGGPCLHRQPMRGVNVTNDVYFLQCWQYSILQDNVKDNDLKDLFRNTFRRAFFGRRLLQETLQPGGKVDFSLFSPERYKNFVLFTSSSYYFVLPVKVAVFLGRPKHTDSRQQVVDAALKLGHLAQAKKDFLNCFGNQDVFGKSGSNIVHKKICWLIVTALEMASAEQRVILKENYGRSDKDCVDKVKAVYNNLDLTGAFRRFEKKAHKEITQELSKMGNDVPKRFLLDSVNSIVNWEDTLYFFQDQI